MSTEEINGFLIDKFNQHSLKEGAAQGFVPCVRLIDNLKIKRQGVRRMIGNVVLVPVTTVITAFNYTLTNVKVAARRSM
tara:strand:- start:2590 stop:2826 length:237 start_codon:yes stop_codon:yes gene_type:complete